MLIVSRKRQRSKLPLVLALLALLISGGLVAWHYLGQEKPAKTGKHFPGETDKDQARIDEEEQFWALLYKQKPEYHQIERRCFVEGTSVKVTTGDAKQDNAFGGVLTDLMKLALNPPPQRPGRPTIDKQNYDLLLSTCPTCGATYFDIDFTNLTGGRPSGGIARLKKSWNLVELCPKLAAIDQSKWTYDQKAYARYLTQKTAGFPDSELGYDALSGAYCSNLSIGYGREYRITGAAWYALAAARFRKYIDAGSYANVQEASLVAMTLGEMYRLLGRQADAKTYFAKALALGGLDQNTTDILGQLEGYNKTGDYTLQLAPIKNMKQPPLGWYVYQLLPNVNAELDYQRPQWSKLDDPELIEQAINNAIDIAPGTEGSLTAP